MTWAGSLRGGASLGFRDHDQHFLRNLEFRNTMWPAPYIGASVQVDYALSETSNLYLSASGERVFKVRGDLQTLDTATGNVKAYDGAAGASFQTLSVSAGMKMRF